MPEDFANGSFHQSCCCLKYNRKPGEFKFTVMIARVVFFVVFIETVSSQFYHGRDFVLARSLMVQRICKNIDGILTN